MIAVYRVAVDHAPHRRDNEDEFARSMGEIRNMKNVSADHIGKFRYVSRKQT